MSPSPRIILSGASRGLGLAVLRLLLEKHNARVATFSRTLTAELPAVQEQYGKSRVLVLQGDIGSPDDNARVVKTMVDTFGGVDGLVLNAGSLEPIGMAFLSKLNLSPSPHDLLGFLIPPSNLLILIHQLLHWHLSPSLPQTLGHFPCKLADVPLSALTPYVQTNLLSTIYLVQPALPYLRDSPLKGRIVLVSSGASTTGYQAWGLYSMAKAGMNSLCRTLAAEEKENGVSVFAVRPGVVDLAVQRAPTLIPLQQMQALIRSSGPGFMAPSDMKKFTSLHEDGALLAPELPGAAIASLVTSTANAELSGEFLDWSDKRLVR
ncbi:hypothetical protein P7C73_g4810, partial [Tremellales sp. Uapishka_1]